LVQDAMSTIRVLVRVLHCVSHRQREVRGRGRTLHLFVTLFVQSADLYLLLSKCLQAPREGICDLEFFVIGVPAAARRVVQRCLHLPYSCDDLLGLIDKLFLLRRHESNLVVESFRECLEELYSRLVCRTEDHSGLHGGIAPLLHEPRGHGSVHRSHRRDHAAGQYSIGPVERDS
jgi:hypothetical protein